MAAAGWMPKQWKVLRAQGYRRCVMSISENHKARETATYRQSHAVKGNQCAHMVPPEQIKKIGLPVCSNHEERWHEGVEKDRATRQRLRDKLDPGPLYDESE